VHNALAYEEGKIKEKISSSQYLTDNIMRMNIGGFCILFLLTFMQGLYLWIQFFKQRNPANAITAVENTNLQKEYTPQVTTNNLKAQEVKQRVSTKPVDANKPAVEVVSTPVGKMDINHIDVYQLLTIPGLSYSQALLIISERTDKGNYSDIEELILRNKLDPTIGEMLRQKIYFSR
jgi:DNA uptake protein ComE-like DNA-binding protein